MKPIHLKSKRLKEVCATLKRLQEISTEIYNLGYKKLEKPVRHGWFKEIVITSKIERYKSKEPILEIYSVIEKIFWGSTKAKANNQWFNQVSKQLIYKDFPTISKKQFNKLSNKAQKMCTIYQYRDNNNKLRERFYIRIPKGAYKIKFSKAYITHSKRIDPDLESEYAQLRNKLLKNGYYEAEQKLQNWYSYRKLRDDKKEKLKSKLFLKNLQKYPIEYIKNELHYGK